MRKKNKNVAFNKTIVCVYESMKLSFMVADFKLIKKKMVINEEEGNKQKEN